MFAPQSRAFARLIGAVCLLGNDALKVVFGGAFEYMNLGSAIDHGQGDVLVGRQDIGEDFASLVER
jgi:hypothetical protein